MPCRVTTCCTAVKRNSSSKPWLGIVAQGSLWSLDDDSDGGDGAQMRDCPNEVLLVYPGGSGGRREVVGMGAKLGCPRPLRPLAMTVLVLTQYELSFHLRAYELSFTSLIGSSAQLPWGVYPPM